MIDLSVINLSRLQFAVTSLYHFLFVPLTLGLSAILAIMETVYVMTGQSIWKRMTIFWGTLFGINFALGAATGIVMEFQFGMNWSYYSHYVGDIFGAPLALEGLMAFFLESTFIGLFFFGWNRISKISHLIVTWLVMLGTNFSALWILIANGWMQNPIGTIFNPDTMRMEMTDFKSILFNPVAQVKFVHTVSAGYVTGAMFVMSVSAFYLLKKRYIDLSKRSMIVAASFGLLSALSVVILGDESGYLATEHQKMKIAAIESMWETEPAPAGFNIIAIPNQNKHQNDFSIQLPYLMGIIGTRSLTTPMLGINDLVKNTEERIRTGLIAYSALKKIRNDSGDIEAREIFDRTWKDLGYALLLKKYQSDLSLITENNIKEAALDTIPTVLPLFLLFRVMVLAGFYLIGFFMFSFWLASSNQLEKKRWFLKMAFYSLPIPWIAAESGWFISEFGRQPWVIEGILPTYYAASNLKFTDITISLIIFLLLYSILFIIGIKIILKIIKSGPEFKSDSFSHLVG